MVEAQRIKYKYDSKRPTSVVYCPNIVCCPRIGFVYSEEVGIFSSVPSHISQAECMKCRREGNVLFLIYQMTDEIQKFIEGGRKYVISTGQD